MDKENFDTICFSFLVYEFDFDDPKETEKKIKRKLKRSIKEPYDQNRVDYIRSLKNELQKEISKHIKSSYYLMPHGKYAAIEDFNTDKIIEDYTVKYPDITKEKMAGFLNFAIYVYYLR